MTTKYTVSEHLISAVKTFLTLFGFAFVTAAEGLNTFDWDTLKVAATASLFVALRGLMNEIVPSKK